MIAPVITIFVRHADDCKYRADETSKRCQCRKHFRWTDPVKGQQRQTAGTRSWAEAEELKRKLEDRLSGRTIIDELEKHQAKGALLLEAEAVFIEDKRVQGVTKDVIAKYTRLLSRLRTYCGTRDIHTVQGVTRDVITGFCSTWPELYPSSVTRAKLRERLRSFLRYCYEAQWLERVPPVPKFKIEEPETQPLTPDEYVRLLAAVRPVIMRGDPRRKTALNNGRRSVDEEEAAYRSVKAFLQTMRWTGLAIRDTLTLRQNALSYDAAKDLYRVATKRVKTGTPVTVPIPVYVAAELLALPKAEYFFWSGKGEPQSATSNWGQRFISPIFKEANVTAEGNMVSHRLRDTFAVDLLEKGVPMEEVSRLLGHKSIRTTEKHYAKWSKGRQDRADDLVSATWARPKTRIGLVKRIS